MGLIAAENWAAPGRINRWRCAWQKGYGTEVTTRQILGRPVLFVEYRGVDGLSPRQLAFRKQGLRQILSQNGVDKVTFSTFGDVLEGTGPSRMESTYLHLYLAGDVGAHVAEKTGATAVCFFQRVGTLEERAILKLAENFRYLMITSQKDEDAVCHALRRRYGLPVVEHPTASQVRQADFALVLGAAPQTMTLGEQCLTFAPDKRFAGEIPGGRAITDLSLALPLNVAAELPDGFAPNPILSEMARLGHFRPSKIKISGLSIDNTKENEYNTLEHINNSKIPLP